MVSFRRAEKRKGKGVNVAKDKFAPPSKRGSINENSTYSERIKMEKSCKGGGVGTVDSQTTGRASPLAEGRTKK